MDAFTQQLREWQLFYATVATAAATLTGLLFVSLSLERGRGRGGMTGASLRMAQRSFGDFLYVIMLALVFLVPHKAPVGLAVALFVLGAARGLGLVRQARRRFPGREPHPGRFDRVREDALPGLACLGLLVVALEVLRGDFVAIYGLVLVVAALLTTASWNAWLLLVEAPSPGAGGG